MITVSSDAPSWAQDLARSVNGALTGATGPFVSLKPFTVANKPDPTKFAWKLIFLSDGAANKFVALSNGLAWYYLQGTAV